MEASVIKRLELLPGTVKLTRREILAWLLMDIDIPVKDCVSSNVKAYGWHAASATLKVIFTNGSEYRYLGIDDKVYRDLEESKSKGAMLSMIKLAYLAVRIEPSFYSRDQ